MITAQTSYSSEDFFLEIEVSYDEIIQIPVSHNDAQAPSTGGVSRTNALQGPLKGHTG